MACCSKFQHLDIEAQPDFQMGREDLQEMQSLVQDSHLLKLEIVQDDNKLLNVTRT